MSALFSRLITHLERRLSAPIDLAGLAVLRILFGAMMAFSVVRFMASGWIEKAYAEPSFFFKFPGFEWVQAGPLPWMYGLYILTALAALGICLGLFYRVSSILFLAGFIYIQLIDITLYLNHYYLVCLIGGILACLPVHQMWSLDVRWGLVNKRFDFPAWATYLLRFQLVVVYFYAALAKAHPDWLWYGQPLGIWMNSRTETILIGPWLEIPWAPLVMSWTGFAYDLTIWIFLLIRPTRAFAYVLVVGFHIMTGLLFNIGMFPVIMIFMTTVFFEPSWPRNALRQLTRWFSGRAATPIAQPTGQNNHLKPYTATFLAIYCLIQVCLPLRHFFIPGDVLWNEQGMRFAWKVMVREKNGDVTYRVRIGNARRELEISAQKHLTWRQLSDMSSQPDLILQLGQYIGRNFQSRSQKPVEVRVDAWVSLNGRRPHLMVDPKVDILKLNSQKAYARWILPAPKEPPLIMRYSSKAR